MSTTIGSPTKLLDEMMMNYSQWHTERSPTGNKVNSFEEISSLNEKVDLIMSLLTKKTTIDPHDVPLNSLVAQEQVDVNVISRNNFNNNAYRNGTTTLVATILHHSHPTTMGTATLILAPKTPLLN